MVLVDRYLPYLNKKLVFLTKICYDFYMERKVAVHNLPPSEVIGIGLVYKIYQADYPEYRQWNMSI